MAAAAAKTATKDAIMSFSARRIDGQLELDERLNFPDGTEVEVFLRPPNNPPS